MSGMVSFYIKGGYKEANAFIAKLKVSKFLFKKNNTKL